MLICRTKVLAGLASMLALSSAAGAASLTGVQGSIMVNSGSGYFMATGPVELKIGDMVLANPGSAGQLKFPDGCNVPLQQGVVITVGTTSPCAVHADGQQQPGPGADSFGSGALIVGGLVIAGGIGLALASGGGSSSSSPASP